MAFVAHGETNNPFAGQLQLSADLAAPAATVIAWQLLIKTSDWSATPFLHTDGILGAPNAYTGPFIRAGGGAGSETIRAQHGATVQNAAAGVDFSQPTWWKFELDHGANELRAKVWQDGDAEPGGWLVVISTSGGTLGTLSILGGLASSTSFEVTDIQVEIDGGGMVSFDDLERTEVGGWGTASSGPTWSASLGGGDAFISDDVPPDPDPTSFSWDAYAASAPNGSLLATIQDDAAPVAGATGRAIRVALNETGSGGFRINRYSGDVASEAVLAERNVIKVRFPWRSDYDFAFILEKGDFTLAAKNEHGGEEFVFGGRGILAYLERGVMDAVAYTTGLDVAQTWQEIWTSTAIARPVGVAFDSSDPTGVYVIGQRSRKVSRINQATRKATTVSPALWSGSAKWAGGLSFDPADPTVAWVLEAPWLSGSTANTKIRRVDRSTWATLDEYDLGSDVQLTDIRADATNIYTSRYDNGVIQQRDKSDGSVIDSDTVTYNGNVQVHPNGIAIHGSTLAYWFGGTSNKGTGRALLADVSDPWTVTGIQKTTGVDGFGGEWTDEGGDEFLYVVNYLTGQVHKYQLTSASPHDPVDGKWRLDEATAIAIAWRIIAEAQAGGRPQAPFPDLTIDFDPDNDSASNPPETHDGTLEFDAEVTAEILATLLRLIPFGVVFKMSPTLLLQAFNASGYGVDRTGAAFDYATVRFEKGVNIEPELARQSRPKALHSHMLATGKDAIYARSVLDDLGYVQEGGIKTDLIDPAALEGSAAAALADERIERPRIRFAVPIGDDTSTGKYLPFTHYNVGDLVTLHTGSDPHDYNEATFMLYAFTLEESKAGKWEVAKLELGSATIIEPPASTSPRQTTGTTPATTTSGGAAGGGSGGGGSTTSAPSPTFEGLDPDTGAVTTSATGRVIRSREFAAAQDGAGRVRLVITKAIPETERFVAAGGTPEAFELSSIPSGDVRVYLQGARVDPDDVTLTDEILEIDTTAADVVLVDYET